MTRIVIYRDGQIEKLPTYVYLQFYSKEDIEPSMSERRRKDNFPNFLVIAC